MGPVLWKEGISAFGHKAQKILFRRFKTEYQSWVDHHHLLKTDIAERKQQIRSFSQQPKISIIMPVYDVKKKWLKRAVRSVFNQIYENWELCLVDDASTQKHIKRMLSKYRRHPKVKTLFSNQNQGIAAATNKGWALAEGEYVGFLDHDDELSKDALFEAAKLINRYPDADVIYSDEDKTDPKQHRFQPFFKPDYSPDWLLSFNYICHFLVCRTQLLREVDGLRQGFEGSQDYDLILRLTERTQHIYHIPKVLYHWRQVRGSTSMDHKEKKDHIANSIKALSQALTRRGIEGFVEKGIHFDQFESYRVKRNIKHPSLVSIIIPTKDKIPLLKRCVQSIREKTDYPHYEVIVVDNQSQEPETESYLSELTTEKDIQVIPFHKEYNFSKINNFAVSHAKGDHILFLNNDTQVISQGWLSAMLEHSQRQEVGAVGAKLVYPDDTIQHAGTIIGLGGVAAHSHKKFPLSHNGYFGSLNVIRNYSAVTAACMMLRKKVFEEAGGFDEVNLPVGFNDVDLCLEMRNRGYLIVYTPYAALYHYETQSRSQYLNPDEVEFMKKKWGEQLAADPYYNPNLSTDSEDFQIKKV
ncbi:MAG: glycosyltransferase [Candidatus Aminicenantes bacterium]|nr:glycosyltransferase [Candidatus Aminicenantes bacterium]